VNNSEVVLKVRGITKIYGTRTAVNNASFDIKAGEIYGLIGKNGAGKTTIIKIITGLCKATSGEVYICGEDVQSSVKALKYVGAIIENPELYGYMSGIDNLKYFAGLYKNVSKNKIDEIVSLVGMDNRINDKVKTYSLGMKQRVGIAQALLHSPKLLILDEPTNGLDPNGIKEMRLFLRKLAKEQNISILISSHNLSEMEMICDKIGIIDNGMIIENKTMEELQSINSKLKVAIKVDFPNYAGKILIDEMKLTPLCVGNQVIVEIENDDIPKITSSLATKGISIYGINTVYKKLEDIFLEIINKGKDLKII